MFGPLSMFFICQRNLEVELGCGQFWLWIIFWARYWYKTAFHWFLCKIHSGYPVHVFQWKYKCNYNHKKMHTAFEQSKGLIWNSLWLNSVQNALVRVSFHICQAPLVYLRGGNNVHFRKRVVSDIEFESNWIGFEIKWWQEHLSQNQNTIHDSGLPLKLCSKTGKNDNPVNYYLLAPGNCCKFEHKLLRVACSGCNSATKSERNNE